MLSRCVVLAATIALVAACGGGEASANPTAIPIAGPWQAQPFAPIDVRFATATEAACREMGGIQPAQVQVVLHDQRGSGVDTVILAGPNRLAECDGQLRPDGTVTLSGGSSVTFRGPAPGDLGVTNELASTMSGTNTITRTTQGGRVGGAVARVVVVLPDGREVTASLGNGVYFAWWPGTEAVTSIVVSGPDGSPVATLNP